MASAADLLLMDPDELELRLAESRTELLNLRFQVATGQLDNTARLGQVRRDIARILTVMREREIAEAEGTLLPLATLIEVAEEIEETDEDRAAEHPGDERYEHVVEEDEALREELVEEFGTEEETGAEVEAEAAGEVGAEGATASKGRRRGLRRRAAASTGSGDDGGDEEEDG